MTRSSPPESAAIRYLARRSSPKISWPNEPLAEPLGQRKPQIRPPRLERRDMAADKDWSEAPPYGFNLWKFRHFPLGHILTLR